MRPRRSARCARAGRRTYPWAARRHRALAAAWILLVAALLVGTFLGTPSRAHAQTSTDATLSDLELTAPVTVPIAGDTAIPLAPSFLPAITTYAVAVLPTVTTITVSPTRSDSNATIAYLDADNAPIADGDNVKDGQQVSLSAGENTINVRVTAEDTVTTQTYTIFVTRLPAADTTAPTISSAETTADGKFITVTFSEPVFVSPFVRLIQEHLRIFEISYFIRAVLDVTVAGHRDVLETTTNLSGNTLTIALTTPPIESGQAVLLSYDNVFAVNSLGLFVDVAGNPLAFFSDRTVTNNSTVTDGITFRPGPVFSVEALTINEGDSDTLTLTAKLATQPSEDVTVYLYTWPQGVASVVGPDGFAPLNTPTDPDSLLTFTTSNWEMAQNLTVSTSSDNDSFDAWALVHGFEGAPPTDYIRQNTSVHVLVKDQSVPLGIALADAPTTPILAPTVMLYLENGATPVATLKPIGRTSATWTLYLDDKSAFSISTSGVLSFRNPPDAERPGDAGADNFYVVGVLGQSGGATGVAFLTVFVQSVPEPPVFTDASTTREVAENSSAGVAVGDPVAAIDDVGDTPTYSLAGTDADNFDINAMTGQISTKSGVTYDHETKDTYSVTVQVSDGVDAAGDMDTSADDSIAVTIRITDVNEAPTFANLTETREVAENSPAGTNVGAAVAASDEDGDSLTYTLSGADADDFTIDGNGQIKTKAGVTYDHETTPTYLVTVDVSDGRDDNGDAETTPVVDDSVTVTITLTDVDEAPTLTGPTEATFVENTTGAVATYMAEDPEGATIHWSLSGVSIDRFAINGGVVTFVSPPDYETEFPFPVLYVHASDSDTDPRLTTTRILVVTVTNVNEGPEITGGVSGTISYDENSLAEVGTLTAMDPEGDPIAWTVTNNAFEIVDISAGSDGTRAALRFNSAQPRPDFETVRSYAVTVRASDGDSSLDATRTILVGIRDLPEDEALTLPPQPQVGAAYDATFTEADAVTSRTWTWERSSNRSSWTCVHGTDVDNNCNAGAQSYTPGDADLDQYLRVTIDYTDSHGDQMLMAVSRNRVEPAPVSNAAPMFANAAESRSIQENARVGARVGAPVTATDDDNDVLEYTLGANDFFTINSRTGQILVAVPGLDHEDDDEHPVDVTATDPSGESDTTRVTITVEDLNEPPEPEPDTVTTPEDTATSPIDVLANDDDPDADDTNDTLVVTAGRPANGTAIVNTDSTSSDYNRITYTPNADFHGRDSFTYTVRDSGNLSASATVTVTVEAVNDAPTFPAGPLTRTVPPTATAGATVGAPVTATDVDGEPLTYALTGGNGAFAIDEHTAQVTVTGTVTLVEGTDYLVTVTATDPATETATATVTITARNAPPPIIGPGGGGGPSGPTPSEVDFEWTVKHDIEELDSGHDNPTGAWSDGTTFWLADNPDGAGDAVYAYDLESGKRVEDREFELDERNRAPRGVWSDRETMWVSDSGRDRLFAYDLATGERLAERDLELAERNRDVRGIWSDGQTLWVLDGIKDSLFAYDLATGTLLAEYSLAPQNGDPQGIWSDGVTIWVSEPGSSPRRLFAYRVPTLPATLPEDPLELERVREEEFEELSSASNNSPRGIWSDSDVMYVADASDGKVYTYNMPDAIDARLASLTLSGVDLSEFDPATTEYEGSIAEGVTDTVVTAEAMQRRTAVAIVPPDADEAVEGHQVSLTGLSEITVTVTSQDGLRMRVYRVALEQPPVELALEPGWSAIEWPGADGAALAGVLPDGIVAVYAWAEATGTWLAYFPALEDVPGLNTLTAFSTGQTYWVAVAEPMMWIVAASVD